MPADCCGNAQAETDSKAGISRTTDFRKKRSVIIHSAACHAGAQSGLKFLAARTKLTLQTGAGNWPGVQVCREVTRSAFLAKYFFFFFFFFFFSLFSFFLSYLV